MLFGHDPNLPHDAMLLLRSVNKKFLSADPDTVIQGAWITTHVKRNEPGLDGAFALLDAEKVHFVVLGDWRVDIHILVKRDADRVYLHELFRSIPSDRFTFQP